MKTNVSRILTGLILAATAASAQTTPPAKETVAPATPPPRAAGFKAGEIAPPLAVAEWVKGAPIPQLAKGKVYLVEFWATWCGPCIGNIPHLNSLQKKYGKDGLVVVGFSNPDVALGEETKRKENNTLEMVRAFVAGRGDRMDYHVAYDTPDKATYKSWMNTQGGIPHAFLIDREGRLAVNYHPFYMDDAVRQVLAGTWDHATGYPRLRRSSALYGTVLGAKTYAEFQAGYGEMEKEFPFIARRMLDSKFDRARLARDEPQFTATALALLVAAREEGDAAQLVAIVRGQLSPPAPARLQELPAQATPEIRERIEAANIRARQRAEDEKTALKLPLDMLAQMADAACEITANTDPAALSAKARVARARGDAPAAVALLRQAVALSSDRERPAYETQLAELK